MRRWPVAVALVVVTGVGLILAATGAVSKPQTPLSEPVLAWAGLDCPDDQRVDFHALVEDRPGNLNTPAAAVRFALATTLRGLEHHRISPVDTTASHGVYDVRTSDGRVLGQLGLDHIGDTWYVTHAVLCGAGAEQAP